jgi:amino acid transporter
VFNGNFVASSRLLFAMGRRNLITDGLGRVHPQNQTPSSAVLCVGLGTAVCMFLGDSLLVPVTEVGSLASALGWLATCAAYYRMQHVKKEQLVAAVGGLVGLVMILMKVLPGIPGHFSSYEWLALGIWISLGAVLGWQGSKRREM